ncbi:hypothetical protein F750_0894 [Streptomyces sp. PAMC 26508]|nr:hypothetical protein F750_0894 [Streptomyces sp. PAMC 26508]
MPAVSGRTPRRRVPGGGSGRLEADGRYPYRRGDGGTAGRAPAVSAS